MAMVWSNMGVGSHPKVSDTANFISLENEVHFSFSVEKRNKNFFFHCFYTFHFHFLLNPHFNGSRGDSK